jgi:hypothetical protein
VRHVRIAQAIALSLVIALMVTPLVAFAQEGETPVVPVVPVDPVATVPNPAPVVVVRSYATSAQRLLIGEAFDLTINVYNATARKADNVVVSLGAATAGATAAGTPAGTLTVLGTGNAKFLGLLKGQRDASITFSVIAGPGTTPGAMTVPVTVSFEHEGERKEVTYTIGLLLERDALLSLVTAELPDTAMQGESFPASFEIANASGFALSGVTLSVEASGADVADGTYFLGTMDAATTEGLDVTITPESAGPLEVAVVLTYRDDFGRTQTFRQTRTVTVEATPEQTSDGPEGKPAEEEQPEGNWFVRFIKALFGIGS